MLYTWTTLLLVSCTLVRADVGAGAEAPRPLTTGAPPQAQLQPQTDVTKTPIEGTELPIEDSTTVSTTGLLDQEAAAARVAVATTRAPPLTLDRQAGELAWRSWLQSPESGNQNAPPRRIITKSLFITPYVCPKGQRLDRNGCVQVVTVNKDEHERILLEQLNALFPSASNGDVLYDYGDDEPGPLQLSLPIGIDPQAAPLQSQEPSAQAQGLQANFVDKKGTIPNSDASIEAELEILKLQHSHNDSTAAGNSDVLNHNVMSNLLHLAEKPKRDSPIDNSTEIDSHSTSDEGQKEIVFGHVNVDPILYGSDNQNQHIANIQTKPLNISNTSGTQHIPENLNKTIIQISNSSSPNLNKNSDKTKLNPENDYSDIGEAIKLISRYAEVTTDDNFAKNQKKYAMNEDSILGTRTKLQYRRPRPKPDALRDSLETHMPPDSLYRVKAPLRTAYPKNEPYYRYPWPNQHSPTPPPDYPFRHLQDYWPGRTQIGGVYNTHENPRRHHHSYPHYLRPRSFNIGNSDVYPGRQDSYPEQSQIYNHRLAQRHVNPSRSHTNNQELYSLLGLRHWFSSEGTSKR